MSPSKQTTLHRRHLLKAAGGVLAGLTAACAAAQASPTTSSRSGPAVPPLRLLLPKVIYAVPGVDMNVYFDNVVLVLNPDNYAFDVTCNKGVQQAKRWTCTPTEKDVGVHPFTLSVRDQTNRILATATASLKVVAPDAGAGTAISLLCVGDSLTHASVYPKHLLELCGQPGNPRLSLVGSHTPKREWPDVRHEGYGGWTAKRFATHYTGVARTGNYRKVGSPFLYKDRAGKPMLDFTRYCADVNSGKAPDFVTIFLGCNDTFSATDETIEARIDEMMRHMDALIQMIRGASPRTRIGLVMLVPPAGTQDAFGANYGCTQTRWQYKRNQHRVLERTMTRYAGKNAHGVSLIPAFVNLDCYHNFPMRTAAWNSRTAARTTRLCNGVHPAPEGYCQIGDSIYCWLKANLETRDER